MQICNYVYTFPTFCQRRRPQEHEYVHAALDDALDDAEEQDLAVGQDQGETGFVGFEEVWKIVIWRQDGGEEDDIILDDIAVFWNPASPSMVPSKTPTTSAPTVVPGSPSAAPVTSTPTKGKPNTEPTDSLTSGVFPHLLRRIENIEDPIIMATMNEEKNRPKGGLDSPMKISE